MDDVSSCGEDTCPHDPTCDEAADLDCSIGAHDWRVVTTEGTTFQICNWCYASEDIDP